MTDSWYEFPESAILQDFSIEFIVKLFTVILAPEM
jgi:hypothetical protein